MEAVLLSRRKLTIFKSAQTLNSKAQSFKSRNFCLSVLWFWQNQISWCSFRALVFPALWWNDGFNVDYTIHLISVVYMHLFFPEPFCLVKNWQSDLSSNWHTWIFQKWYFGKLEMKTVWRRAWHAAAPGLQRVGHDFVSEQNQKTGFTLNNPFYTTNEKLGSDVHSLVLNALAGPAPTSTPKSTTFSCSAGEYHSIPLAKDHALEWS